MAKTKKTTIQKLVLNRKELDRCIAFDIEGVPCGIDEELYTSLSEKKIDYLQWQKETNCWSLINLSWSYQRELSELEYKCLKDKEQIDINEFHDARGRIRLLKQLLEYIPILTEQYETEPAQYTITQKFYALQRLGLFETAAFKSIVVQKEKANLLGLILGTEPSMIEKLIARSSKKKTPAQENNLKIVDAFIDEISLKKM
jgi:hypothetical protein